MYICFNNVLTNIKKILMSRTITPILWSRKTKEGNRQIYIRLTENRKSTYFTINKSIPQKYWNKEYKCIERLN